MSELLELAGRVEAANGWNRELDALVAAVCRTGAEEWEWAARYPAWVAEPNGRVSLERNGPSFAAPNYTASLDAAMTLVPDGWVLILTVSHAGSYVRLADDRVDPVRLDDTEGASATAALALCAAALRARAHLEDQSKAVGA